MQDQAAKWVMLPRVPTKETLEVFTKLPSYQPTEADARDAYATLLALADRARGNDPALPIQDA
jgi:hypothetical protein